MVNEDEEELELEDAIFEEISEEDEEALVSDAALLDENEDEDEFVRSSIDVDDLSTGFDASIPRREIDVDEDTQGDEEESNDFDTLMTEFEGPSRSVDVVHGDEVQLDLDDAMTTGRTVTRAPETD